jgi:hypothetical protein
MMNGDTTLLRQRSLPRKLGMVKVNRKVGCVIQVAAVGALTEIGAKNMLDHEEFICAS